MDEIKKFRLGLALLVAINACQFAAAFYWYFEGDRDVAMIWFGSAVVTAVIFAVFLGKTWKDIREGQPTDDERSRKIRLSAAGYSFFISIYVWIGLIIFQDHFDDCTQILSVGIIAMAVIFLVLWGILDRRGDA